MVAPTRQQIEKWSKIEFAGLDEPFDEEGVATLVEWANDYVVGATGNTMEGIADPYRESLVKQGVLLRVEQLAFQAQPDYVETGTDDQIGSFSAGSYSEQREEAAGARRGMTQGHLPVINPWGKLNTVLWELMTPEKREYWLEWLGMASAPAFETTEVFWGYDAGRYNVMPGESGNSWSN